MTGKIIRSLFSLALLVLVAGACLFSGILYSYYEKQSFASLSQEAEQLQQTLPVGRAQHGLQRVGVLPQPVGQFLLVHGAPPAFLSMGQYMPRRRKT